MFNKIVILSIIINSTTAKNQLNPGKCLKVNESLESNNKCFKLIMQDDGNLVLYHQLTSFSLWSTQTQRTCTNRLCMQADGNLVTYDCNVVATWNSETMENTGAVLILQDDGNAVIYAKNSTIALWASGTVTTCS